MDAIERLQSEIAKAKTHIDDPKLQKHVPEVVEVLELLLNARLNRVSG